MGKRVKLTVAYDGTNYCGWQVQPNGITIESELNRCLSDLLKEDIHVIGASRTDAGVHARGNVAVFDTEARMPAEKFSYALNTRLPADIRIQDSYPISSGSQKVCKGSRHHRFSDTAFSADHADHMFNIGIQVHFHLKALGRLLTGTTLTAFSAAGRCTAA